MSVGIILHIQGEEPIMGEMEDLPSPTDVLIKVGHPRRIDGKDISYLADSVTTVYWPVARVNFLEIMPSREDEQIIGFVRD